MRARFVSLRVTETWQMVQGHDANSVTMANPAAHEVAPRPAEPPPREREPIPTREPFPVD